MGGLLAVNVSITISAGAVMKLDALSKVVIKLHVHYSMLVALVTTMGIIV